ncbi:MAG: hypothetical protein WCK67_07355 [bacterium]
MVNSSNRIYTNPVLPQKIEVQFSSAPKLEQFLSQKTDTNVADNVKISDKLDVNTQEYRTSLESSQNYVSSAQNTLQNIDEVKKSISDYQNSDEKELKQDDFLKSIDNSLTKTQGFSSGDTSSLPDNTVGFVGVLNKIKENMSSSDQPDKVLTQAYSDVSTIQNNIEENMKAVFDFVQTSKDNSNPPIADNAKASEVMDKTSSFILGNMEKVKDFQSKALDGDTILALLKAR